MNKCILALCSTALLLSACNGDVSTELKVPVYKTGLPANTISSAPFAKLFPAEWASYELNNEDTIMTVYKGSVPYHKNNNVDPLPKGYKYAQPYLKNLWLGYPFMYEYNETRGHTHAVTDFLNIDRINRYAYKGGLPATCWNCKTPKMMTWVEEYGDAFWAKDVNEFRQDINPVDETIGCANCHDPDTMELRLYSVPLKDWLVRSGKYGPNGDQISRSEMRSLVCAQCHVEYYFTDPGQGVAKKPVFPWDNGVGPEEMYQYYKEHGDTTMPGFEGQFTDWVHPASGTPMIKMQHPDYEMWKDGPHGSANVACADCHMPYQRSTEGKKMSSHYWTSPLKDPEMRACRQCHSDKSPEYLRERVLYTQSRTFEQLLKAQENSVRAHETVRLAATYTGQKADNYDALMIEARDYVRKGQLFWDYVSAENGVGFHNPSKALTTLAQSYEYSQKAIDIASQATNYGIAPQVGALMTNVQAVVPPILTMSRKLQQDPGYLQTNPWLALLKPLPEAPPVWEGQTLLIPDAAKQ